jgi:hypothetical protein
MFADILRLNKERIGMKKLMFAFCLFSIMGCRPEAESPAVQEIVDRSIEVSGGELYKDSMISFDFRGHHYVMEPGESGRILKRIRFTDSITVTDVRQGGKFLRLVNDSIVAVPDSMATRYANSINSVHYFAYLPYGLNDPAVNKKLLGEVMVDGRPYYEVQVTFDREGGGKDFEDVYVYWFNKQNFKPDFLAYEFETDGGGMRFRKAYNERYVGGIRFVDYYNYESEAGVHPSLLDSLYQAGKLRLLSKIELRNIEVNPGSGS